MERWIVSVNHLPQLIKYIHNYIHALSNAIIYFKSGLSFKGKESVYFCICTFSFTKSADTARLQFGTRLEGNGRLSNIRWGR